MKGRANDKIRTKLRGGWPKLIGRAFSTIVDSLSFYSYPRFTLHETHGTSRSFSRNISKAMTRGYLFSLLSWNDSMTRAKNRFIFLFFFSSCKEKHPSLFEGEISHVPR